LAMHPAAAAASKIGLVAPPHPGAGIPPAHPYGSPFWSSQFSHQTPQDVKPFAQSPYLDKPISSPSSMPPSVTPNPHTTSVTSAASMAVTAAALQSAAGINSLIPGPHGVSGQTSLTASMAAAAAAQANNTQSLLPDWHGRTIGTSKLRLLEYSAYVEQQRDHDTYHKHLFVDIGGARDVTSSEPMLEPIDVRQIQDKFPEKKGGLKELYEKGPADAFFLVKFWADLNTNISEAQDCYYNVTAAYESTEHMNIQVSTKVCSFGKQVVEKLETEYPQVQHNGRYLYKIARSPMCEYMVNFIHKLKHLPEKYMMNSVLENFTILQVITNRETQETLLCIAFVFEVSNQDQGAQHHIYKLVKD